MLKKTESSSTFCNKFECNLQQTALIYAWLNEPHTPHHGFEKKNSSFSSNLCGNTGVVWNP